MTKIWLKLNGILFKRLWLKLNQNLLSKLTLVSWQNFVFILSKMSAVNSDSSVYGDHIDCWKHFVFSIH